MEWSWVMVVESYYADRFRVNQRRSEFRYFSPEHTANSQGIIFFKKEQEKIPQTLRAKVCQSFGLQNHQKLLNLPRYYSLVHPHHHTHTHAVIGV
jgi:hypothetical protein